MAFLFWEFAVSFALALVLTPIVRNAFLRLGIVDHPGGRKVHQVPVPRVGGIAIAIAYLVTLGAFFSLPLKAFPSASLSGQTAGLILAVTVVFATGLVDDLIRISPAQKLLGQVCASLIAFSAGIQIHVVKGHPLELWMSLPLTVIWLVGCSNAFNLIDGMDGLASGIGFFATITMLIAAVTHNNLNLAIVTVPLVGCLFGFLRYNFNPASIFLGDCGSLMIGFLLGCYGVMWGQKSATLVGMTAPMMSLSIPLIDAGLAIVRRYIRNQPIFGADRGHIHHRLLDRGLTVRSAALVLYLVCTVMALLSLLQNSSQKQYGGIVVILFAVVVWLGVNHLGYTEFSVARKLVSTGELRRIIDEGTRLRHFEQELLQAQTFNQSWQVLRKGVRQFGLSGVRVFIQGRVLEDLDDSQGGPTWQMRIPLPESQYVNLYCPIDAEWTRSCSGVARAVEGFLREKLTDSAFVSQGFLELEAGNRPGSLRKGSASSTA